MSSLSLYKTTSKGEVVGSEGRLKRLRAAVYRSRCVVFVRVNRLGGVGTISGDNRRSSHPNEGASGDSIEGSQREGASGSGVGKGAIGLTDTERMAARDRRIRIYA